MKRRASPAVLVALCASASLLAASDPPWPEPTPTARPWIRWWWPGSAVEPAHLRAELRAFAEAGLGGVEITPIYGARGAESRTRAFLSPDWVGLLEFTTREAHRLGLAVDMATGTGWPFGGPWVSPGDGSSALSYVDGRLTGVPTQMNVKRAAPGGEGLVLDPYSPAALERYLRPMARALGSLPPGSVRSQFHDSFEYFNASWSPALPAAFQRMHGYDLQSFAAELGGARSMDSDTLGRIKGDYRRTLASLHLDYLSRWVRWSHERGFRARNQAHGAPGMLLDLYAAADIPETESFGATRLPIDGLEADAAGIREDPDPPINLIGRMASSAAHVMGRPLVSSETLTWLRENFRESPAAAKPQLDRLFIAGINHVFYHGATYSPADAAWPGWFFYAATQLNPRNPLWRDFGAMHAYVTRVQSVLQAGRPDNDLLLYWPEADWQDDAAGLLRQQGMHDNAWLRDSTAGRLALRLLARGHAFDFISDAQLARLKVDHSTLVAPGGRYRALLVPATRRMAPRTLRRLEELRRAGAALYFESLPADVPGYARLAERREELARLLDSPGLRAQVARPCILERLVTLPVSREPAANLGLWLTRRARAGGHDYFLVNPTAARVEGWVSLGRRAVRAQLLDPMTGAHGWAAVRAGDPGTVAVYLQLESGQSMLLRTFEHGPERVDGPQWVYAHRGHTQLALEGPWEIEFIDGGPALPAAVRQDSLRSWTQLDAAAQAFSGTARYRIRFEMSGGVGDWLLDLGTVRETARVTLNGQPLGTVWSVPATLRVGPAIRSGSNLLEIEVTNLPANRIRDLDRRKVDWKVMRDINLVDLKYRPFDAAAWELAPSGLLGPVRLVPLEPFSPGAPPNPSPREP